MPLIANNLVIGNQVSQVSEPEKPPAIKPAVNKPAPAPTPSQLTTEKKHHVLIVNGKEKKVRKQSAYMLDMLTIDDE